MDFHYDRGIRYLLFVDVIMGALSRLMFVTVKSELLSGFSVGLRNHEEIIMTHLLFADDALIFCDTNCDNFVTCGASSYVLKKLKINLSKSEIAPVGDVGDVEGLVSILGCGVASLPMKHLDLPLGASYKTSTIWNGIIEKMEHRLGVGRGFIHRERGRLTLIKSILSNLSVYYVFFPYSNRSG
jgi:hypothetical protein